MKELSGDAANPRAYLVPLHADKDVRSHAIALARYGDRRQLHQELRELVEGFGAPWREPVALRILHESGRVEVPEHVFLGTEISRQTWFAEAISSCFASLPADTFIMGTLNAQWHGEPAKLLPGIGSIWQVNRSVLVVDLDGLRISQAMAIAVMALPSVLRPWSEPDMAIAQGKAYEWDSYTQRFLSPAETRRRWRVKLIEWRSRLLEGIRIRIHSKRWKYLRKELEDRAEQRGSEAESELRAEILRAVEGLDLEELVDPYLRGLAEAAIARPANPSEAVKATLPREYNALIGRLRIGIRQHIYASLWPGSLRDLECPREHTESTLSKAERARFDGETTQCTEDEFLERIDFQDRVEALCLHLTPAEQELLEGLVFRGESPVEYAQRTGRALNTVYVQKAAIKRKAKGLRP